MFLNVSNGGFKDESYKYEMIITSKSIDFRNS